MMKNKVSRRSLWHLPVGRIMGQYVLRPEYNIAGVLNHLQSIKRDWRMSVDVIEIETNEYEYQVRGFPYGGIFPDTFAWGRIYHDSALDRLIISYDVYTSGLVLIFTSLVFIVMLFVGFLSSVPCVTMFGLTLTIFYGLNMASSNFFLRRSIPRYFEHKT
jgi:hypothetical protein